jgi:hypothetical protein
MNQEFEEKFYQIYDVVSNDVKEELKRAKGIISKYIYTIVIVSVIINLALFFIKGTSPYRTLVIALTLIFVGVIFVGSRQVYRKKYKLSVVKAILKEYMDTLGFDPDKGFPVAKYREYAFDQSFNDYYSEDQISGNLPTGERITLAEVRTKDVKVEKDKDGKEQTEETVLFHGMFGEVELHKSTSARIRLDLDSFMRKYSKDRIEIDSEEFESYFDLSSDNRMLAIQIFTSDMIEKLLEIKNINKQYNYELKIIGDKLVFRYKCGDLFEPPAFGIGINRERVKDYFRNIYYPVELVRSLVECINYAIDVEVKNIDL